MKDARRGAPGRGAQGDGTAVPTPGKQTQVDAETAAEAGIRGKGAGSAVPWPVREQAEATLGADLSDVRVHDDPNSRAATAAMGARAYAHGDDIFLGPGASANDTELMGHELTHVVQQRGGSAAVQMKVEVGGANTAAEVEADAAGAAIAAGKQPLIIENGAVQAGQMTRSVFLVELERAVKATATTTLGPEWSAQGCPYIEQWFATHRATPAADLEKMARRYAGIAASSAKELLPAITSRLAAGIARWKAGQDVSADLRAAGLAAAATAAAATQPQVSPASGAQRKLTTDGGSSPAAVAQELGAGAALDGATSQRMGDAFGQSFDHVRVHTGPVAARKASELGAAAFTVGADVAFGAGQYQPGTPVGDALLAHELAHVSQQRRAGDDARTQHGPIGGESAAAEVDANQATQVAVGRLVDPTKTAPRANAGMDTGFQLQRCSNPDPTIASAKMKGSWEGKRVATQHAWSTDIGDINQDIDATRTLGAPQQSEQAALALVKTNGKAGAITLEAGIYFAYETNAMSNASKYPASVDAPKCEPGIIALVTSERVVYRPGTYDPGAKGPQTTDDSKYKKDPGDPFQGYKDALNNGNDLDGVDNKTLIPAFEAAMLDTALDALKQSERAVNEKKPKFDKGMDGVPDDEVKLIRDTAIELLPLQKKVDHGKQRWEGGMALARTRGVTGELAYKALEEGKKELDEFSPKRNAVRAKYPMLARLSTTELEAFTKLSDKERVEKLAGEMPGILRDIDKTRDNLVAGKIDLWESSEIITTTMQGLGITSKEKKDAIAAKKKDHERGKTFDAIAKAVINIGLGIGATLIGGPVGFAMAAGAMASDVVDAIHDTDDYFVKKAASNTDLDPNKSILDPESVPGWGWLIMSWGAVGLDIFDVRAAVKAIETGEKTIAKAAEDLAQKGSTKGLGSETELAAKLKRAAGELASGEVLTEANKAGVAARLGLGIEIDKSIAETEVRLQYKIDRETGKVEITGLRIGVKATIEDVLAHGVLLKLMRRYEGLTGKIRQLWDKLLSLGGKTPAGMNPFPPGSQAYNSWLEVKKLPAMIEARAQKYGPHLSKEAEAALRQDIDFLETELAHHQKIVDQMVLEAGQDFIAKTGDSTLKCTNELGYKLPDVSKGPPLSATDLANSSYYYRLDNGKPTLVKKANKPGASLRAELGPDGKPTGTFATGELSREEKGAAIVASMPAPKKGAFEKLVERIKTAEPGAKVVPIDGIASTKKTIAQITEEFGDKAFKPKLTKLLTEALEKKGMKSAEAADRAKKAVEELLGHEIMVVKGTDQLRAYGYRPRFISATGQIVEDDLHHMIPLYLGGDHTIKNLIDIDPKLHDAVHELCDSVKFSDGVTLAPWSIQNAKELNFTQGAAILHTDGTITYDTLATVAAP